MQQSNVSNLRADAAGVARQVDRAGLSQAERIAALRAQMDALMVESAAVPAPQPDSELGEVEVVGMLPDLARALPDGGLPRRQVTAMGECPALVVELLAHVTAAGQFAAVVGWPELGLAHVAEAGDLDKLIAIPDPGADPWGVTAVLVEGLDVVIHRGAPVTLSPARARPLLGKLRGGRAALVTVGAGVPSPALRVDAHVVTYRGIGAGTGRINGVDIAVTVDSKGSRRPATATVTCGQRRRLEAV